MAFLIFLSNSYLEVQTPKQPFFLPIRRRPPSSFPMAPGAWAMRGEEAAVLLLGACWIPPRDPSFLLVAGILSSAC